MKIIKGALVLMKGEKMAANLYQLKGEIMEEAEASGALHSLSHRVAVSWHQKLGHISEQRMKILVERKLIPDLIKVYLPFCEYCVISKQHHLKFKASNSKSVFVLELVHSDVWQALVQSLGGASLIFWLITAYFTQETTKLDSKSRKCLFLGYADGVKGYHLWDSTAHKVVVSRDVVFMEDKVQENEEGDNITRETATIQMEKEFQSNDSFEAELVPLPGGRKPIGNKWVYKIKRNGDDQVERYRARLVVKGYAQKEGIDFNEISPVVRMTTVRVVLHWLKAQLAREFKMKDLGPANKIQGMQIHSERGRRKIWRVPYASAVGSLMFAMICTRPDIAHAVGVVSRYMAEPGREHWEAVKRILRYIKGTSDVALCYGESGLTVKGYVDSDYAGDLDGSKSTTGYVFTLSGGTVRWVSKLQSVVAMSTTEAEYVAAAQASKMLLEELGHEQEKITLFCDNQSALYLARNPAFHSKTKHIRVQYHFVREKVEEGTVDMQKIHTDDNMADYMTKAINCDKFIWCRSSCGLAETSDNLSEKGKKGARLGDTIVASVKEAQPGGKVKKGQVVYGVVVRAAMQKGRCDGSEVKFDDNAVVLVNKQGEPIGTRVVGPVPHELRKKKRVKILSLAQHIA
ncbi:retrovirus-related pol polyprotein from transposon TNT 1-94 [Tanacetum coccineum]